MDIVIVLQIITIVISILTFVSNSIIAVNENRKKNYLNLTTSYRIQTLTKTRELVSNIIVLATPQVFKCVTDKKEYIREIIKYKTDLEIMLKDINEEELELKQLVSEIVIVVCDYLNNSNLENEEIINNKIKKLEYLFSIYDSTDWKFIKKQSTGKIYDNKEWLEIYEHYKGKFPEN